ncbi:MAG: glycosyltransferase family 2 protein [Alphaproteobacteria bacterium]
MIVIPMAGLSRRFADAGYSRPKYMLDLRGRSVFAHAVGSFRTYFASEPFLLIVRDVAGTPDFVRAECRALGIRAADVVTLDEPTRGQAETVALGLEAAAVPAGEPVTVFNIDTFRPGFRFPAFDRTVDGWLEVFPGSGLNWSYVRPMPGSDRVVQTTEKVPISDLCCTGMYHFGSAGLFRETYDAYAADAADGPTELYVAPMYNLAIAGGADIRYARIDPGEVIFCGVPAEYEALLREPAAA